MCLACMLWYVTYIHGYGDVLFCLWMLKDLDTKVCTSVCVCVRSCMRVCVRV